jgi:hypothetical protein
MSELDIPADDTATDPAEAFERMRRQLALLTAAVEGFASRQQAIEARDYAPDIARLIERQERFTAAIRTLADRPAMALTPEVLAIQIADAGKVARRSDQELIQTETARQRGAAQQLEAIVGHARTRQQQTDGLIWAILSGMMITLAFWVVRSYLLR